MPKAAPAKTPAITSQPLTSITVPADPVYGDGVAEAVADVVPFTDVVPFAEQVSFAALVFLPLTL